MTSFLHWCMTTWALVLWSAYIATGMVITGSGAAIVALWWLAGLGVLQLVMQPLYQTGRTEPSRNTGPSTPASTHDPTPHRHWRRATTRGRLPSRPTPAPFGVRRTHSRTGNQRGGAIAEQPRANPTAKAT